MRHGDALASVAVGKSHRSVFPTMCRRRIFFGHSTKPERPKPFRKRPKRDRDRLTGVDPWRSLFGGSACPGSGHSARSYTGANAPIFVVPDVRRRPSKQDVCSDRFRDLSPLAYLACESVLSSSCLHG
jgi:hypothetical protein